MKHSMKGKLRELNIRPGANGWAVHAHHDMPTQDKGTPMMDVGEPSKPSFFANRQAALEHAGGIMAAHEGANPMNDHDADDMPDHPLRKAIRRH